MTESTIMKILAVFLGAILLSAIIVVTATNAPGNASAEERDERLASASSDAGADPGQVVVASGNNRFVTWVDFTSGNGDIFFRRSVDGGATWQPVVNLSNNAGTSSSSKIAAEGTNVYVVWSQENPAGTQDHVYFRRSVDDGLAWGPQVKISSSTTNNPSYALPQIAASGAFVHITWYDDGPGDAFYRRSTNSGASFKPIVNLSNSGTVDTFLGKVALAVSGAKVYVAWDDFFGTKDVLLRSSTNNGMSFGGVTNLSGGAGVDSAGIELAATGSFAYAVWSDGPGIVETWFSRTTNSGSTWSAKVNLSNNAGGSSGPALAFSGSNVFVVWHDLTPGNFDILMKRSTNNGASFLATKNLSSNTGSSMSPEVATSDANVYFAWKDTTTGNGDIYLRRSSNNGATLQPLTKISANNGNSASSQVITVGADAYVVWEDNTPGNYDIMNRRSTNNGLTWQSAQNLSSNPAASIFGQMDG
jgi:hypothetical protein